jgi:hypothetical protein
MELGNFQQKKKKKEYSDRTKYFGLFVVTDESH